MRAPLRRTSPLVLRLTGGPLAGCLAGARREVARWARALGLDRELVDDLVLASHEALANAADHAYPDGRGEAWVHLGCTSRTLEIEVRDRGRWRPPAPDPGWRGRGLMIIRRLADDVDVQHDATGTVVRMRWWLT